MQLPNVAVDDGGTNGRGADRVYARISPADGKAFQLAARDATPSRLLAGLLNYQSEAQKRELVRRRARQSLLGSSLVRRRGNAARKSDPKRCRRA